MRALNTSAPHGRPPRHAQAHGLRRAMGGDHDEVVTAPIYDVPGFGGSVPVDNGGYQFPDMALAAAVGDTASASITIDQAADFEWVAFAGGAPAANQAVTVELTLVGGPFAGLSLTSRPIRDDLIIGTGSQPHYLPAGTILPKNSTLRMTVTNLTANAQSIRPTLLGRNIYSPTGRSVAEFVSSRVPYWLGYEFLPQASGATGVFPFPPNTSGDFQIHYHNAAWAATDGATALTTSIGDINFRDRGQQKNLIYNEDPTSGRQGAIDLNVAGNAQFPHYWNTRRAILAGDSFEVRFRNISGANRFIRGCLGGVLHLGERYFA